MLSRSIADIASALRRGEFSATELMSAAIDRHSQFGERLQAYKLFDGERALESARAADLLLASDDDTPPLTGIPMSVKDLYGVDGLPTFAGTPRQLPEKWSRDAWLVARLRGAGAITVGKTHMVEMAFGGVGINPNWDTPWNPWDDETHRIPGGSSSGAGVSLWEGSALIALGSDTGGSIRIPAALTGTVGQRTTKGRWPTDGVVPLSHTLDTVGALTRTVEDSIYFFGCVDPRWGDPQMLLERLANTKLASVRMAIPRCGIWDDCEQDIADELDKVLSQLGSHAGSLVEIDGGLIDDAFGLSTGRRPIASTECRAFLESELPGWLDILHPIVGSRVALGLTLDDPEYLAALADQRNMAKQAGKLFDDADILVLPGNISLAAVMVTASFIAPVAYFGGFEALGALDDPGYMVYVGGFLYYLVLYTVIFFFNTGLVGATLIRLDGGDPTVGDGMSIAIKKLPAILEYAALAATVGLVLRAIEERVGVLGRIVVGLIGVSWTLTTYMTVPVLVTRDVGAIDAVKESAHIFKRTWGEQVMGNAGIGLASFLLFALMTATAVPLIMLAASINGALVLPLVVSFAGGYFFLVLVTTALKGIYSAALYRFATTGSAGEHFDAALMEQAFRPKKRRW